MGQTLLRELADVGKRLEHEKTQRCFVQGCGPPPDPIKLSQVQPALDSAGRVGTRLASYIVSLAPLLTALQHADMKRASACRSMRDCREELAELQALVLRQAADMTALRSRVAHLEAPWLWRCGPGDHVSIPMGISC